VQLVEAKLKPQVTATDLCLWLNYPSMLVTSVSIKPVAIIIEAALMVHFMKTKTGRVPSEVATAMRTHKNDNIVVTMAVSLRTKILPAMI
jgi:hypothetical protein